MRYQEWEWALTTRRVNRALLLVALVFLVGEECLGAQVAPDVPKPGTKNVWFSPNGLTDTVFVFVHGFLSDDGRSFRHMENGQLKEYWPRLVWSDARFGHPAIFLGGYNTGPSYNLFQAARELHTALKQNGVLNYPRIIFIAHSLGGIVVRRMLCSFQLEFQAKELGLLLFGSPSSGSLYADIASQIIAFFADLLGYEDHGKYYLLDRLRTDDETLLELDGEFDDLLKRKTLQIYGAEAVEEHFLVPNPAFDWLKIVPERSACHHYFQACTVLAGTDHFSLVAPAGVDSTPHKFLAEFYTRFGAAATIGRPPAKSASAPPIAGAGTTAPLTLNREASKDPGWSGAGSPGGTSGNGCNVSRARPLDPEETGGWQHFAASQDVEERLWALVQGWVDSVQSGDVAAYRGFYVGCLYGGGTSETISRQVISEMQIYPYRAMQVARPRFFNRSGVIDVTFAKSYRFWGPNLPTRDGSSLATLTFWLSGGQWKIVRESEKICGTGWGEVVSSCGL
jgi:pimeloyl-ACP methyl ester carboxylesterase